MTQTQTPKATIEIDQKTIESALIAHLFGDMIGNPEMRENLLTDLISHLLQSPERSHEKETLLQKVVKEQLAKRAREIAEEWLNSPEATQQIKDQVSQVLGGGLVGEMLNKLIADVSARIGRGF